MNLSKLKKLQNVEVRCLERDKKGDNKYPKDKKKKDAQQTSDYGFLRNLKPDALSAEERKVFDAIESWK